MNLKQAFEDWIGDLTNDYTDNESFYEENGRNKLKQELRASLPSLLAKIEQHVLEARKDEAKWIKQMSTHGGLLDSVATFKIDDRIAELDALLNTKGEKS